MPSISKLFLSNCLKKPFKEKEKSLVTWEDVSYKHSMEKKSEQKNVALIFRIS